MAHINATAEEIRAVIQQRIKKLDALDGKCRECEAPMPVAHPSGNPGGSHWTVVLVPDFTAECDQFIFTIVYAVMTEYELVE